ncbi:MAG TPA: HEAT repeat domain-containing protein [Verrucomicrobiae bacterium]|jgi:HEAT repeat protein
MSGFVKSWLTDQKLRFGSPKVRLAVVEKLAQEYDSEAAEPLIFALKDKSPDVRSAAARALLRHNATQAVEPLITILRDTSPIARAAAAETLGRLGDLRAIPHLVGLLRDVDLVVRGIAVRSLIRLGWKPDNASDRVLQILATGELHELVSMGPEGVGHLLDALRNGTPHKQFTAAKALGRVRDPRVQPAMLEALNKNNPALRVVALGMLEKLAEPQTFDRIKPLLQDDEASVRGAAVDAITTCGGKRAVPLLLKRLKDPSWEVRLAAAKSLGKLRDISAVDGLCQIIQDPDRDVRESVIVALRELGDARAVQFLVLAMLDPENVVRSAALATLFRVNRNWSESESAHRVLPKIKVALSHNDYWVSNAAVKLLELMKVDVDTLRNDDGEVKLGIKSGPSPVYALFAELLFDRDRDLRMTAAVILGQLGEKSAAAILATASRDADLTVRQAATTALAALE